MQCQANSETCPILSVVSLSNLFGGFIALNIDIGYKFHISDLTIRTSLMFKRTHQKSQISCGFDGVFSRIIVYLSASVYFQETRDQQIEFGALCVMNLTDFGGVETHWTKGKSS